MEEIKCGPDKRAKHNIHQRFPSTSAVTGTPCSVIVDSHSHHPHHNQSKVVGSSSADDAIAAWCMWRKGPHAANTVALPQPRELSVSLRPVPANRRAVSTLKTGHRGLHQGPKQCPQATPRSTGATTEPATSPEEPRRGGPGLQRGDNVGRAGVGRVFQHRQDLREVLGGSVLVLDNQLLHKPNAGTPLPLVVLPV